jgi:hypothetical protein
MLNQHSRLSELKLSELIRYKWIDSCAFLCYLITYFFRNVFGAFFNDIKNE